MDTCGDRLLVVTEYLRIPDITSLVSLVCRQMESGREGGGPESVGRALENALRPGGSAVLFLCLGPDGGTRAFAFGNTGSGLESRGDYFWINELYVDDRYRRRGLATFLLNGIGEWARNRGIRAVACVTGDANEAARAMYRKHGFDIRSITWVDKQL